MPPPNPPTTTAGNQGAADYESSSPIPTGGLADANVTYRAPIGVGYQTNNTGGDLAVFDDGSSMMLSPGEAAPQGARVFHPGQVITGPGGAPVPYSAQGTETVHYGPSSASYQQPTLVPSRYREGAEWQEVGTMPPELRAQVQQAMIDRGLYGSKAPRISPGAWDNESAAAFKQVLGYANATGQDWRDALQSMPIATEPNVEKQVQRSHYNITLSHPADLAEIFKRAASSMLGGSDVPQEEIDKFVRAFQSQEKADQQAAIAAEEASKQDVVNVKVDAQGNPVTTPVGTDLTGSLPDAAPSSPANPLAPAVSTTTKAADPNVMARQQLKERYPGRVGATALAGTFDKFLSILDGMGAGSEQGQVV